VALFLFFAPGVAGFVIRAIPGANDETFRPNEEIVRTNDEIGRLNDEISKTPNPDE
jgi:hypothetical protein